ncbi:MAG: SCP2 sterol-binding domain-containing protein [Candidatus Hodarchaeales archaeon]|jgi:putative sterol carrier protein
MSEEGSKFNYLTNEWIEEVVKRVKVNLTAEDMKNVSSSMKNIYQNCPDGKNHYLYFKFDEGQLTEALVGDDNDEVANKKAEFRIIGDYEVFAKISRAELGARSALMRNKIKLKGNMIKALRLASIVDRLNKVIATVPTEF